MHLKNNLVKIIVKKNSSKPSSSFFFSSGKKKAREEAEKKFQQRIDDFERQEQEQEHREREKILNNNEQIARAKFKEDQPVDDSAVVDDMFGFLESQNDNMSESQAPSAFRDLPAPKVVQNGDIIPGIPSMPEDFEDLSLTCCISDVP